MGFEEILNELNGIVWGIPMLSLLLLTGLFLMVLLRFMPLLRIPYAFGQLFRKRSGTSSGDVSPFSALMTALSSTIGTGNIGGVAAAIAIGGPGAVFWMWMTAIFGTATKYAEGVLAVKFREVDASGRHIGGPMYYIRNGLGKKFAWLALLFSTFGVFASWGTGAYIQSNTVSDAMRSTYDVPPMAMGILLAVAAAAVILGGIKRIATVASKLVPAMAMGYLSAGLIVIAINIDNVPAAFGTIFQSAFGMHEATTGISIGLMLWAMQKGVARGIFSNEAGQGSAPIAHAAAQNKDPVNQGIVAMLGTVIDTLIVCTVTALIILTSGLLGPECLPSEGTLTIFQEGGQPANCLTAAPLTIAAFNQTLPGIGEHIVTIGLVIFGFTTILGWSYYGERCAEYLLGPKVILPFRMSWIIMVFFGAFALTLESEGLKNVVNLSWLAADTLTALMAAPNLVALLLLSPLVAKLTQEYFAAKK